MTIVLTRTVASHKPRFKNCAPVVDGAANKVLAVLYDDGMNGTFVEVYKITPAGVQTHLETRPSEVGKMDMIGAAQSGANLHVFPTDHDTDPKTDVTEMVFLNVCIPYPGNAPQVGKGGAFVPNQAPDPTPTYTLQDIINGVVAALQPHLDVVVGNIRPKVGAEIQAQAVLRESTVHDSAGLYSRLDEILYEYGFRKPPHP